MFDDLLQDLKADGFAAELLEPEGPLRVSLAKGFVEVWNDAYGCQYDGDYHPLTGKRIELQELAHKCGLRTQFMYHDEPSRHAVLTQIRSVLGWLRNEGF